ncbi:MAG: YraN family protein [Chloroflexi bacterium]|nr:MAG: YraN family protein [Chloroflexota bacterium]
MGIRRPQGIRHPVASRRDPATRPKPHSQDELGAVSRLRAGRLRPVELGRAGEKAAAELLRSRGYQVIGAGFLARRGELDLVCRRGNALVIVEVKTRASDAFGTPLEAVGARKRRTLRDAAAEYRALAEWRGPIRYAVVGLMVKPAGGFDADLVEDPFD